MIQRADCYCSSLDKNFLTRLNCLHYPIAIAAEDHVQRRSLFLCHFSSALEPVPAVERRSSSAMQ